ncbi:hypothetical protein [Arenimonas sp.]|uniref:hypothetical protein n=1 Tax=Arenimonas sp. TaxID=1872635 RepID=UPI0039E56718
MSEESLKRLVGMTVMAAYADEDSADFRFTACSFSAFGARESSQPVLALIGHKVQSVAIEGEWLKIGFVSGDEFSASLVRADRRSGEAYSASFDEDVTVTD